VPADPSSPIPTPLGLAQLRDAGRLQAAEPPDLLAYLATIPDPRARPGRRHPLVAILALAAAAVLSGARSFAAIAEWATDAPQAVRSALGVRRDPLTGCFIVPTEATIRRTLGRLDAAALAALLGAWLAGRDRHQRPRRRAVAVDGKTLRGACTPAPDGDGDGRQVHLLACMDHATRAVLAQQQVGGARPRRCPPLPRCWSPSTWPGVVVTADALQTHPDAATLLVTQSRPTTCFRSRPTSPPCWRGAPACPGTASLCWTAPQIAAMAAWKCAPSRRHRPPRWVPPRRPGHPGHP
jgi:DDE_Tnp_1-associated